MPSRLLVGAQHREVQHLRRTQARQQLRQGEPLHRAPAGLHPDQWLGQQVQRGH